MREIRNVVCQNVFPSVSLTLHGWLPPLRNALSGMECGEESQVGESARRLSGRCSLRFLLAHPKKSSPNDEAVSQEVTKREIDGKTWLLFQLSPVLTADGCHWGMSAKEWQTGKWARLSSRHSIAVPFFEACPLSMVWHKGQHQWKGRQPWYVEEAMEQIVFNRHDNWNTWNSQPKGNKMIKNFKKISISLVVTE